MDDDNSTLSVEGNQRREWVEPTETPVRRLQELAEGNPNLSEHDSGINLSFGGSTGDKRRYTENKLTAEDTVYVRGLGSELSENQEGAAGSLSLQVGAPDSGGVLGRLGRRFRPLSFLVADASGDEVARRYGRQALWSAGKTVALVAFLCSIVFVAAGMN